jgi:beta propeller repeat protein
MLTGTTGPNPAPATDPIVTYPLTQNEVTQYNARISGSTVVWSDYRNGNWDIWGLNLETLEEFPICTQEATQDLPCIEGNLVVWRDLRNGNWDIYGCNLDSGKEFPICTAPGMQWRPSIYGSIVVWQDKRSGDWDIYCRDLTRGQERTVAVGPGDQEFPCIYRDIVVWADDQGEGGNILGRNITYGQSFVVAHTELDESRPCIYGDIVIWRAMADPPYWDIVAKRLSTGEVTQICTARGDQWYANLCGEVVVWDDRRGSSWEIYGYDLATKTEFPICVYRRDQLLPDIDDYTVVWHDLRDGVSNLWAADLSPLFRVEVGVGPEILNPGTVWLSFPVQPLDPDPAAILGEDLVYNRLQRWDPLRKTLETYPDDFTQVETGVGYYLALDRFAWAQYRGIRTNGDQVIPLRYSGWIWIGTSLLEDVDISRCIVRNRKTGETRTALADPLDRLAIRLLGRSRGCGADRQLGRPRRRQVSPSVVRLSRLGVPGRHRAHPAQRRLRGPNAPADGRLGDSQCGRDRAPGRSLWWGMGAGAANVWMRHVPSKEGMMAEHLSDVLRAIHTRRSVRRYKTDPIPPEHLHAILEAARIAPSAANRQPWHFVVVTDRATREKLAAACKNQMWLAPAPVIVCACSVPERNERWHDKDTMIAMDHLILAAWSLGYGTCWIGAFEPEKVREVLAIPEGMNVVALTPVGLPDEAPSPRPRAPFEEIFSAETAGRPLSG